MIDRIITSSREYEKAVGEYDKVRSAFEELLVRAEPLPGNTDLFFVRKEFRKGGRELQLKVSIGGVPRLASDQSWDEKREIVKRSPLTIELTELGTKIKIQQKMLSTNSIIPVGSVVVDPDSFDTTAAGKITDDLKDLATVAMNL